MENRRIVYDFCTRCGGLTKNGVCPTCQNISDKNKIIVSEVKTKEVSVPQNVIDLQTPQTQNYRKILTGIVIAVILFFALFVAALSMISSSVFKNRLTPEPEAASGYGQIQETYGDIGQDIYVPSASDEYYVTFVDFIRDDLAYQIEWEECSISNEDETASFNAVYPQITGEMANLDYVNAQIEETALRLLSEYELLEMENESARDFYYYETMSYVTYMDENLLSIVFMNDLIFEDFYMPTLDDINIDVKSGTVLTHDQIIEYSEKLGTWMIGQDAVQNSGTLKSEGWSAKEVKQKLESGDGTLFFTPVGLEMGFSYYDSESESYGWLTATLKEYKDYLKN